MLHYWCRRQGASEPSKVLIWWKSGLNPLKSSKSVEIWTNSLKIWANPWKHEQKWCPTACSGMVATTCGTLTITSPVVQNPLEISFGLALWRTGKPLFWRSEFFWAKILPTSKNLPASSPMCCTTTDLGIFGTVLGIFGVAFVRALNTPDLMH